MRSHRLFLLILLFFLVVLSCSNLMNKTFHVGYITLDESFTPEDEAVWQWLENHDRFLPERIDITEENSMLRIVDH